MSSDKRNPMRGMDISMINQQESKSYQHKQPKKIWSMMRTFIVSLAAAGSLVTRQLYMSMCVTCLSNLDSDNEFRLDVTHQKFTGIAEEQQGQVGEFPLKLPPVQIFYNVFLRSEKDEERVRSMIHEQLAFLDPEVHNRTVLITSIGRLLTNISQMATIREHQVDGAEALTLHALWEYCRERPTRQAKVVYLHSKGSFHNTPENKKLRPFLTKGAMSKECANLPESCDVCSSHMSALPHPHTPGNMWLARCDYIAQLIDPNALQEGKLSIDFKQDNSLRGFGRYFYENWVHSHPEVRPCDLYSGKDFTYGYENIPDVDFELDLKMAPRFNSDVYQRRPSRLRQFEQYIWWNYKQLYNITPDEKWWGWNFFKHVGGERNNTKQDGPLSSSSCYDPDGPVPIVLMTQGRSGSAAIWQVLGKLTGREADSDEFTGGNTRQSYRFFEEKHGSQWVTKRLCGDQRRNPDAIIVGFKWKPNRAIYLEPAKAGLMKMAELNIPVIRSKRNELDVLISRQKHANMENNVEVRRAHCQQGDTKCEETHRMFAQGMALNTTTLLGDLTHMRREEEEVDNLLEQLKVPVVHVSYDKLFYDAHETADEWMKIFRFLGVGPQEGLTLNDIRHVTTYAATINRDHRTALADYDTVAILLRGTEFEGLLRSDGPAAS